MLAVAAAGVRVSAGSRDCGLVYICRPDTGPLVARCGWEGQECRSPRSGSPLSCNAVLQVFLSVLTAAMMTRLALLCISLAAAATAQDRSAGCVASKYSHTGNFFASDKMKAPT